MVGIFLVLLFIYFIIRVIGIYRKEIGSLFLKLFKSVLHLLRGVAMRPLLNKLEQLGFYKNTDKQIITSVKKDAAKSAYLYADETKRLYMSDAENLAEGFIEKFYQDLQPFLVKEGVVIESFEQQNSGYKYEIKVNDRTYMIYEDNGEDPWEMATHRSFDVINMLLEKAGSKERLYSLYGGNDLFAVFLTEDMYKTIQKFKWIEKKEKPAMIPRQF